MRTRERTREIEAARMSRTQDGDSRAAAHDGEHAEHHEKQRHGADSTDQVSTPGARLPQRAIDWEVRDERVEFTVGPGCIERYKELFELIVAEPPLSHRVV